MSDRELYKKIDKKKALEEYWKITRPHISLIIGITLTLTIIEATRLTERYLFKRILDDGAIFASGALPLEIFKYTLLIIAAIYIGILITRVMGNWIQLTLAQKLDSQMTFETKKKYFRHIIGLSYKFHTTKKTGGLISRMNRGTRAVEAMNEFILFIAFPLIIQTILIGGSLVLLDWTSALVVAISGILLFTFGIYIMGKQKEAHVEANYAEDSERANMSDILSNIESVKYFGKENSVTKKFENLSSHTKDKLMEFWRYGKKFSTANALIMGLGIFFALLFPMINFINGKITLGTVAFIYSTFGSLLSQVREFVRGLRRFHITLGDFDSLVKYKEIKNEVQDKTNAERIKIRRGEIEFRDVNFTYHKKKTIDNFSLKINPDEKIALVGHSGCGKTTLIKLLYRFYNLDSGKILIDGQDISEAKQESLRSELSIVPQEAILFDDTIYNNIAFSNPKASRSEVIKAIKFAQLDKLIKTLPDKENTIVGERGVKLSGGERQRVSIARALLADKKILVLDEATSALDSQTEHEIQEDLRKLMQNRTSIIIAHRLSTIMRADKIVVMEKGKIVQVGKHEELIKNKGIYRDLWSLQKGGYLQE